MSGGIVYKERYPISFKKEGDNSIPVIDYSSRVRVIYNKDFGLTREAISSEIISMTYGEE